MIETLSIKNFKSIKEMDIDCKRINLFIGEPNTGKSNILEALGLLSHQGHLSDPADLKYFLRFEKLHDLFFDGSLKDKIEINTNLCNTMMGMKEDNFFIECSDALSIQKTILNYPGDVLSDKNKSPLLSSIKYYKFLKQDNFPSNFVSYLLPPNGSNLFALAMGDKEISDHISSFFEDLNLKLMLKTRDRTFEIVKQKENLLISYPYITISDTLQRIIFFTVAMESNKDSTLIFEEPESFAFPYYTKYLGERIAFDESNQYFISTHNPYLLLAILEKAPRNDVNVFATTMKDFQTIVKPLTEKEIPILMDSDPFFNLGQFLDEDDA